MKADRAKLSAMTTTKEDREKLKQLKVYGSTLFVSRLPKEHVGGNGNTQQRVVVATTTWKRAAELLGQTLGTLKNYASITGNDAEVAHCLSHPEKPFYVYPKWSSTPSFYPLELSGASLVPSKKADGGE